jgi:putative phage-type endonuclease|tara:strand:- start:28 stop:951 length:924 start_codon:yes stop_codon:yes gene_type:complete
MESSIEKLIWSIYKIKQKLPKKTDYKPIYNVSSEEFNDGINKIKKNIKQLNHLKTLPIVEQRTDEWYEMRKNMLTASDTYNALIQSKSLVKSKAKKIIKHIRCNALTWGIMFEPIAANIYSKENNDINIYDFGVIRSTDTDIEFYGASPDGITSLGVMLEIKCPITRKIKENDIKKAYMAQVQGQMAVCQLTDCDFAEFEFEIVETLDEFLKLDDKYYGLIVVNKLDNVKFDFYSKLGLSPLECYLSIVELDDRKIIYWKLRKVQVQRVLFNKNEWEEYYKPKIIDFWDTVANYVDTDNDEFRSDSD